VTYNVPVLSGMLNITILNLAYLYILLFIDHRDLPILSLASFIEVNFVCLGNVNAEYQFPSYAPDVESANEHIDEFLSIDCERLAESVRCVPLHERLHIDQSLFDASFITYSRCCFLLHDAQHMHNTDYRKMAIQRFVDLSHAGIMLK